MLTKAQCKDCKHIFTYNSHTITMDSKIEQSMFKKIVLDTVNCVPIKKTVVELDLSIPCVFENGYKLPFALEYLLLNEEMKLGGIIEDDKTFELERHKDAEI